MDIKSTIDLLNKATEEYDKGTPIISDKTWDNLYFELEEEENRTNVRLPNSPTQRIHYNNFYIVDELKKIPNDPPMLSLSKTKDIDDLVSFCKVANTIAMLKMDGLSCRLIYKDGKLATAATRGNGTIGEDITHNAIKIPSIPLTIDDKSDEVIIDGEIICTYKDFKEFEDKYIHPRNFAAGSIRLLDNKECANRKLTFVAWDLINSDLIFTDKMKYIQDISNDTMFTVPYLVTNKDTIEKDIAELTQKAFGCSYPIDGLVFRYNNTAFGRSLGNTAHHPKHSIAYKFYDDLFTTHLIDIDWTMGRTGVLTPTAVFDEVIIDNTSVTRASLHNVSMMKEILKDNPYKGQEIQVFKSNSIIPQVADSVGYDELENTNNTQFLEIPKVCPICWGYVTLEETEGKVAEVLVCKNPECNGKLINKLDHFCSKKGLDIKGLSKATLEKLIDAGFINSIVDIFNLSSHAKEWESMVGFGKKSVNNILSAIEERKNNTSLETFIAGLGIPGIGITVTKKLIEYIDSYEDFRDKIKNNYTFYKIPTFGLVTHMNIIKFNYTEADELAKIINIVNPIVEKDNNSLFKDKVFVITGKLTTYKNRDELKDFIERNGGKVTNSVTKNTNYLINNDIDSNSTKNKTAKKLNVEIISEEQFKKIFDL